MCTHSCFIAPQHWKTSQVSSWTAKHGYLLSKNTCDIYVRTTRTRNNFFLWAHGGVQAVCKEVVRSRCDGIGKTVTPDPHTDEIKKKCERNASYNANDRVTQRQSMRSMRRKQEKLSRWHLQDEEWGMAWEATRSRIGGGHLGEPKVHTV